MDEQILQRMILAERIGIRYASRGHYDQDEAVAEAYFWLVIYFREYSHLGNESRTVGIFVKRRLIDYFERTWNNPGLPEEVLNANTDEEMLEYLQDVFKNDDAAGILLEMLNRGLLLDHLTYVRPDLLRKIKDIKNSVSGRIKRLMELPNASRKVKLRELIDPGQEEQRGVGEVQNGDNKSIVA